VLLAGGLALLGVVTWEHVGTNVVSQRRQAQLVEEVRASWVATGASTRRTPDRPSPTDVGPRLGTASALVRIPRFGDDYVVPVVEGTDADALASGLGHDTDTAGAGERGNYVLAGHRVTHGEALGALPSLRSGDVVEVETRDAVFTYVLDTDAGSLVVDDDADWVVASKPVNPDSGGPRPSGGPRLITLVTCAELFRTSSRMVVFGHLVRAEGRR
jgi:sortase A